MSPFDAIQAVVFDMDGVIWRGDVALPGVPAMFDFLGERDVPYVFATNNASKSPDMYVEKLGGFGVATERRQIITSAVATSRYLRQRYPEFKTVFVVGTQALIEAMTEQGFAHMEDQTADLVVAGHDPTLTYAKLRTASYHIQGGALFVGTNPDKTFPEPEGYAPGAGSVLAALETATGQTPLIIGKPHPPMFEAALQLLGTSASNTLMIGDRLETDIVGANQMDMLTALVLSGISKRADIGSSDIEPTMIFDDLADLLAQWQAHTGN